MKSITNDDSTSNTNWLGFSLSPHQLKMEVVPSSDQNPTISSSSSVTTLPAAIPTSFFHSPPQHFNYGIYCGVEGENGGSNDLYSHHMPVMPLKSDGSLCIVEALHRSHTQVTTTTSTPKLEDFFGGATMGSHHYQSNDNRETLPLSLDSLYYQHHQQIQVQNNPYFSNLRTTNDDLLASQAKEAQVFPTMGDDGMKNWVSKNYQSSNHAVDNNNNSNVSECGGAIGAVSYGDLQSLSLSMSPGSQSSCVTGSHQMSPAVTEPCVVAVENKKRGVEKIDQQQKQIVHRKSIDTFGQRTSQYRGVTRHRWTGRYEAHLWDNSCKKEGQSRKGRQVYLGGYDMEEKAARAYDLAALKYWGPSTHINFSLENYQKELEEMKNMSRQEYVAHLRRKSSGFSRGASMYRGVTRSNRNLGPRLPLGMVLASSINFNSVSAALHIRKLENSVIHVLADIINMGDGRLGLAELLGIRTFIWEHSISCCYSETSGTQEEAAEAYDIAAIKFRGTNAVTNFDITRYDVERIMASSTLLAGELARRNKDILPFNETNNQNPSARNTNPETIPSLKNSGTDQSDWKMAMFQSSLQPDQKPLTVIDSFKAHSFSLAPETFLGSENISSIHHPHHQQELEDSNKIGTTNHLSNASSLVTSLSSSREGSPDKASLPMAFAMPPSATSKLFTNPNTNVNSWMATAQVRPTATAFPQMPVFAAWTDA